MNKFLGSIVYLIARRHREIALSNLSIAFPQFSLRERKKIAFKSVISIVYGSFELLYFLRNPSRLQNVHVEGRECLDKALEKKKGAIILTAHLGNFPLLGLRLVKAGLPVNFVIRPMRDKFADDYFHNLRTKAGVKTIFSYPRKDCISKIIKALRNNELVVMLMDQNFGTGGVWVKFFGKLAATPVGSIVLALRTKAAIVPAYIYRKSIGMYCIKIFPEEELILTENKDETIFLNAVKFTRIIESWIKIKEVGFQWGWVHKRWKSRPSEKIKKLRFKIEK